MNKYLRFRSPSLATASSNQYVLVNVSKMTFNAAASGGGADFDLLFYYGGAKATESDLTLYTGFI